MQNVVLESGKASIEKIELWILGALVAAGGYFRFWGLNKDSLWFDEAVLWQIANENGFYQVLKTNAVRNSAPPIYAMLLHLIEPWASSAAMLRSISFLAGVLGIVAFYFLLRSIAKPAVAIAGTMLLAFAPVHIQYSHELREYSLAVLLAILIFLFYFRYLDSSSKTDLSFFALFSVLGLFTQYGLAIILFGLGINTIYYMLISGELRNKLLWRDLSIYVVVVLFSAIGVWFVSLKYQMSFGGFANNSYLASGYWDGSLKTIPLLLFQNTVDIIDYVFSPDLAIFWFILMGLGVGHLLLSSRKQKVIAGAFCFPWLAIILFSLLSWYPYGGLRQNIFLLVNLIAFAAIGLGKLYDWNRIIYYSAIGFISLAIFMVNVKNQLDWHGTEDMATLVRELCSVVELEDRVYVESNAIPAFEFYWQSCALSQEPIFDMMAEESVIWMGGVYELIGEYKDERVWLVTSHLSDREIRQLLENISNQSSRTSTPYFSDIGVGLFEFEPVP